MFEGKTTNSIPQKGNRILGVLNKLSGDIVLYKEIHDIRNEIFWGEMYLLSIDMSEEEYITVKYIQKAEKEGYVRLVSQNKHHQDKDVELSKIKALALVKASIRINAMH